MKNCIFFLVAAAVSGVFAENLVEVSPSKVSWPMEKLKTTPEVFDASEYATNDVEVAFLEGLSYKGKPTRIFCYWGVPAHKEGEKVPGIVLVHGGGGSAFYRWVKYWNERGYAAVSMDTCGAVSGNVVGDEQRGHFRHADGGPKGWGGFSTTDDAVEDQWMYHAVADAIIGNSFLRSLPGVDPERIGITGVSWGGVITCIAASQDDRFCFAAPVYGCGAFLGESSMWDRYVDEVGADKIAAWKALWDPVNYLPDVKIPILWLAGTNDTAFSLPSLMESYALVPGEKHLSLKVRLKHTHGPVSENSSEVAAFADSFCRDGATLPIVSPVAVADGTASCHVSSGGGISSATLAWTSDADARWENRTWSEVSAALDGDTISASVPSGATSLYLSAVTDDGCVVSSEVKEMAALPPSATSGAIIQLDSRSTVLWRTVKTGETATFSIDWPSGAASAELNLYSRGRLAFGPYVVQRNGDFSGGYVDVEIPLPSSQDDERVYEAVLSFKDSGGAPIAGATQTERFAAVMGGGNARPTVVCSDETAKPWSEKVKRIARYVVFQIPDPGKTLYVDGVAVETGLDGAAGWFETKLADGTHTARLGDGELVAFNLFGATGLVITFR